MKRDKYERVWTEAQVWNRNEPRHKIKSFSKKNVLLSAPRNDIVKIMNSKNALCKRTIYGVCI